LGSLYRRGDTKFIWIAYYKDGKQFLESTRSESEDYAKRLLKLREGEIAQGKQPAVLYDRIRVDELLEDLLTDYRINKRKRLRTLKGNVALLKKEFGGFKASRIDTARIRTFIDNRMKEGVAHATINRAWPRLRGLRPLPFSARLQRWRQSRISRCLKRRIPARDSLSGTSA